MRIFRAGDLRSGIAWWSGVPWGIGYNWGLWRLMVSDNQTHIFDQPHFEFIKKKYGYYSSWAIWADGGEKPKDNVGDLSIFDINTNAELLQQLNPNVILVGLNISRGNIKAPLANFHDARPQAMDFKI